MNEQNVSNGFVLKIKNFFKNILSWCRNHKIITVIIIAAIITMAVSAYLLKSLAPVQTEASYSFVRTTTLAKNGLETVVNVTGSVESADTSTVSYSAAAGSAPKIKTVNAAVGDYVEAGDIIVVLDNTDILESIENQKEALDEKISEAYEKYEDAAEAYESANEAYDNSKIATNNAYNAMITAKNNFDAAKNNVKTFQTAYDKAYAEQEKLGVEYNKVADKYNADYTAAVLNQQNAQAAFDAAKADMDAKEAALKAANTEQSESSSDDTTGVSDAQQAYNTAKAAYEAAAEQLETANQTVADIGTGELAAAKAAYEDAQNKTALALNQLNEAKKACNYSSYENAYNSAVNAYNTAVANQQQLDAKDESARKAMDQAYESYLDSQTSDSLEELYEQLENCNLKAETNGKVTSLNATVGATANGTIATIQNTDSLKISVTIQEADINTVSLGMNCNIRSDATEDTISGTLTQIDPVSSMGGSFGAEVTVNGGAQGLLIGMNADVDIVVSAVKDCFTVPADAIGEDETGSFIYRHTAGEGVDMEFEKVYITVGESNDYYVEISSIELAVGDVIRSYADLTVGIEEVTGEDAAQIQFGNIFGGMGGFGGNAGAAPSGDNFGGSNGQRPEMPGGNRSNNGGGMPSGMPNGGGMP